MTTPALCPWGDSLIDQMIRTVGNPATAGVVENYFARGGIGGETTAQILARFALDTSRRNWNQLFWGGVNSFNATQCKADIATWWAAIPHQRKMVMGLIPNGNLADEQGPSGARFLEIVALNNELRLLYGDRFYDTHEFLTNRGIAAGNARSIANGVPSSVDQPSAIHLIAAAYNALLADVRSKMKALGFLSLAAEQEQITLAGGSLNAYVTPVFTSASSASVEEHRPYSLLLTSNKPNAIFEIAGGPDAALFSLIASSGKAGIYAKDTLFFRGQDYEAPADVQSNNTYVVDLRVTDGLGNASIQTFTLTVTNTDDTVPFTETTDYITRFNVAPHVTPAGLMDTFIRECIRDGNWSDISGLWILANGDPQSAVLNVKGATNPLVNNGALLVPIQGALGDGVDDYLEGPTLQALDPTLNPGNFGLWRYSLTNLAGAGVDVGFSNSADVQINGMDAQGEVSVRPLSAAAVDVAVASSIGLAGFQRFDKNTGGIVMAANQVVATALPAAVNVLPSGNIRVLASQSSNFSTRIVSLLAVTKFKTQEQCVLFAAAVERLIAALVAFLPEPQPQSRLTINFNGANGSTNFVDEDGGKVITVVGNVACNGSGEAVFDGVGDRLTIPDSPDWIMPIQFSIRARFTPTNLAGGTNQTIVAHWLTTGNQRGFQIRITNTGRVQLFYSTDGTATTTIQSAAGAVVDNKEYELLMDRDAAGKIRFYLANITDDGVATMIGSATFAGEFHNSTAPLTIGDIADGNNPFFGRMRSVIVWKDITICGSDAGYDPTPAPPAPAFKLREALRFPGNPDLSSYGIKKELVAYESSWFPTSTLPRPAPTESYIKSRTTTILNNNPGLLRLIIDIEPPTWQVQSSGSSSGSGATAVFVPDQTFNNGLQYRIDTLRWANEAAVAWAASHGTTPIDIVFYGEVPCRDLNHLTGSASTNVTRTAVWKSRHDHLQTLFDAQPFELGSGYTIGALSRNFAVHTSGADLTAQNNATKALFRQYLFDFCAESKRKAPSKQCLVFLWPEYDRFEAAMGWSLGANTPRPQYVPNDYWRAQLDAAWDCPDCDGIILWSLAAGSPAFNPNFLWFQETLDFIADKGITIG